MSVLAIIAFGSFRIFSPFIMTVLWGIIIAISLNAAFGKLERGLGGRNRLAATIFIVISLALFLTPIVLLSDSLLDGTVRLVKKAEAGALEIPPPTEAVKRWPLIGERAYDAWQRAHLDLRGTAEKLQPQLRNVGRSVVSSVAGLGGTLVQTIFAIIIPGIFMMTSEGGDRTARAVARRLAGDVGPHMLEIATGTIRSVVKGVLLVAVIQALLAAIGFGIASVPAAGL